MQTGMEMMLSRMIGISPDEMREIVNGGVATLKNIGRTMARIESKQNLILEKLEIDYDDREIDRQNGFADDPGEIAAD